MAALYFHFVERVRLFMSGHHNVESFERQLHLSQITCSDPNRNRLNIDLRDETIELHGGVHIDFHIDALRRDDMLNGRDAVSSTLQFSKDIHAFERNHWLANPWLKPAVLRT